MPDHSNDITIHGYPGEPRSIEETERQAEKRIKQVLSGEMNLTLSNHPEFQQQARRDFDAILAERDSLLTRVSELEARFDQEDYWKRGFEDARVKLVAAESRIESLVGERDYWHKLNTIANGERNALVGEREALREERDELLACVIEHHKLGRIDEMRAMGQCTICRSVRERRSVEPDPDTFHSTPPSVGGDDSGKDRTTLNDILDHQGEL